MFKGVALPEETSILPTEEAAPQSTRSPPANTPRVATVGMAMEPAVEKRPLNKFSGWEKVLCPSRPMVATGQILPPSKSPRLRPCSQSLGERPIQIPWTKKPSVTTTQPELPSPTEKRGSSGKGCCPLVSGSNGVSEEESVNRRGTGSATRPTDDTNYIGTCHGSNKHQLHHKR